MTDKQFKEGYKEYMGGFLVKKTRREIKKDKKLFCELYIRNGKIVIPRFE